MVERVTAKATGIPGRRPVTTTRLRIGASLTGPQDSDAEELDALHCWQLEFALEHAEEAKEAMRM
jgi:hypothetical protein